MATTSRSFFVLMMLALLALAGAVVLPRLPAVVDLPAGGTHALSDVRVEAIAHADVAAMPSEHAVVKHGALAWEAIHACNSGPEQLMTRTNPANGRKMTICMKSGRGYVVVDDADGNNITAYPKDELRFWDELVRYLRFSGYTRW